MTDSNTKSQMQIEIENAHIDRTFYRIHDILDMGVGEVIENFEKDRLSLFYAYWQCVKRRGLDWFVVLQYPIYATIFVWFFQGYSEAPEFGKLFILTSCALLALVLLNQSVFKLSMFAYTVRIERRYKKFLKKNPNARNRDKLKVWFDLHDDFLHDNRYRLDKECQDVFREWIEYYVSVYRGAYGNGR